MYLKKLTMKEFQKHKFLELNFVEGVNYIHGDSDSGKSCIRRAIGFLYFNDPRADAIVRREGSKQTSVAGLMSTGVEVERVKSASINRYIVRVPGQKEQVYDSIGSTIPEEVQQVLQMHVVTLDKDCLNLNMADQISLPFLSDVPGSTRLKLFNKLTGNDLIDKVVTNINKEILSVGRDLKTENEVIAVNQPEVGKLESDIRIRLVIESQYEEKLKSLKKRFAEYKALKEIQLRIKTLKQNIKATAEELGKTTVIEETKIEALKARLLNLKALQTLRLALISRRKSIEDTKVQLTNIPVLAINLEGIQSRLDRVKELKALRDRLGAARTNVSTTKDKLVKAKDAIQASNEKYKSLLKDAKICPLCKAQMTEEHLAHVSL